VPTHWEPLTWERAGPVPRHPAQDGEGDEQTRRTARGLVESARQIYRFAVPLKTRLAIDARVRKLFHLPAPVPEEHPDAGRRRTQLGQLAAQLEALASNQTDAGKFQTHTSVPAVVFFNTVSWNSVAQRPHHFARGLAARGHQVFWVETDLHPGRNWWTGRPLRQVAPGVHLLRLPGPTEDIYRMPWNQTVLDAMCAALTQVKSAYGIEDAISLVNFPRWQPLAARLRERHGWKVVYDCLDDQRAFADLYQLQLGNDEDHLIDTADLLITSSSVLEERLRPRRTPVLLHNAADYDVFSSGSPGGPLHKLPRPVAGFFGVLTAWLDVDLIRAAAIRFPDWTFVYIGPQSFPDPASETRWRRSTSLPNITVLSPMDHFTLVAHLADFDVCIMPFLDVPVTRAMNPVKIYEYLAAGKPVVSRDLPEMRHLAKEPGTSELLALYSTREQFFARLLEAVSTDTPDLAARRQRFAQQNDWSRRVDVLSEEIAQLVYDTSSMSASSKGSNTRSQE
jgi:glycosyltransferase involved in cell wall biosynthesis